jgi:hypothetical protein
VHREFFVKLAELVKTIIRRNLESNLFNFYLLIVEIDADKRVKVWSASDLDKAELPERLRHAAEKMHQNARPAPCDTIH